MYYRKDLLAKEGLSPPTTWEQLESDAKKLQKAGSWSSTASSGRAPRMRA